MKHVSLDVFRLAPLAAVLLSCSASAAPVKILEPAAGATVPLLTDAQKAYLAQPRDERRAHFASDGFRRKMAKSPEGARKNYWPKPVRLAWEAQDGVDYAVTVSCAKTGKSVFESTVKGGSVEVDNLEIARNYDWTVTANGETAKGSFATEAQAPRFIRYPGVPNVRDFGGRIGLGGKRVRQGLVIRSAGLNENATTAYYTKEELERDGKSAEIAAAAKAAQDRLAQLKAWQADPKTMDLEDAEYKEWCTRHRGEPVAKFLASRVDKAKASVKRGGDLKVPKGLEMGKTRVAGENGAYIRARFGIKTDIDLRSERECYGMTGSPLGASVNWVHVSSGAYSGLQSEFGRSAFKKVFRVFLDEKNYPIDFHCIAGQDRTGSLAYILGALLGVSAEELEIDWEVTGFWNSSTWFRHETLFDKLVQGFEKKYPDGKSVTERAEAYVLSLGFTSDDIAKFRRIMLED